MPKPDHDEAAEREQAHALSLTLLDAWTTSQQLWLTSRQDAMPHHIALPLAQMHAAAEKAVTEAKKAGIIEVERGIGRVITAIRPAGGGT